MNRLSRRGTRNTATALALGLFVFSSPNYGQSMTISDTGSSVVALPSSTRGAFEDRSIQPFKAHIAQAQIEDLRRRIAATRFPERETVDDFSQGVQLEKLKPLIQYWGTQYDWRRAEAKLNALPQFVTNIDGLDIHFIHVRSRHPNAMPMLMTHGWPGSVFELLKVVDPLVNPAAHGGRAEDAFDLVLPSYPGYGFSGKPQKGAAWGPGQVGRAFHELMLRLGYNEYVSQGGDWGAIISEVMAVQAPKGLLAIHINMPGTVPPSVLDLIRLRQPTPATFTEAEKTAFAGLEYFYRKGFGYAEMMNTRPQTLGYSLADSPVGMLAFYYDKFTEWTHSNREPEKVLSRDDMLDNVTLYWLTNTGASSSRSYGMRHRAVAGRSTHSRSPRFRSP
jgi:pimeloyl-ACP methyl ester carboxylesterase